MKTIGFIGGFDKTDLILYVAKMLRESGRKILFIDATINQRARYIVPTITPGINYVTQFEGYDVAVGFHGYMEIKTYLNKPSLDYDFILIDVDSRKGFENFNVIKAEKKYFVTAFDNYSLRKGLSIIGKLPEKIQITKILFSKEMSKEEDVYLNFVSANFPVQWEKNKIYFPHEQGDCSVIIDNQRAEKIRFKSLTMQFKQGLFELATNIDADAKQADFKRLLKNL